MCNRKRMFCRLQLSSRSTSQRSFASAEPAKYYALFYKYKYAGEELLQKRAPHREAHLNLAKTTPELKMGGAWGDLSGALIIFHGTKDKAEEFAKNDPYTKNGIVESWELKEWTMVATKYPIPTADV